MAKAKEKNVVKTTMSKKEKMMKKMEEERKMAEKLGEPVSFGTPDTFTDFGRDQYQMTSILGIDLNICGFKKGSINVIYGESSAGKSTNCCGIMEGLSMINPDLVFSYIDTEQTIDDNFLNRFTHLNQSNIFFTRHSMVERVFDEVLDQLRNDEADFYIIDSYDATSSKSTQAKSFENDNQQVMGKASVLSNSMPEIQELLKKNGSTMIFVQQIRQQMKQFMAFDGRSGGNTLKFAPSTVLKLTNLKDGNEKNEKGEDIVRYVKIKNEKSKVSQAYKETFSYINTDPDIPQAIMKRKECLDYAIEYGLITRRGSYYFMDIVNKEDGEIKEISSQGTKKLMEEFNRDLDLYTEMKLKVYAIGLPPEIFIVKFDEILDMLEVENSNMKEDKIIAYKNHGVEDSLSKGDKTEFKFDRKIFTAESVLEMALPEKDEEDSDENYICGRKRFADGTFKLLPLSEQNAIKEREKAAIVARNKIDEAKAKIDSISNSASKKAEETEVEEKVDKKKVGEKKIDSK